MIDDDVTRFELARELVAVANMYRNKGSEFTGYADSLRRQAGSCLAGEGDVVDIAVALCKAEEGL